MNNFEEKFNDLIQKKIINDISKQDLIKINYDDRYKVSCEVLKECYEKIDIEKSTCTGKCFFKRGAHKKGANKVYISEKTEIYMVVERG